LIDGETAAKRKGIKMPDSVQHSHFKEISVAELAALLQQGGIRLLDVRTDAEVARGKIPQSDPMPLHLIAQHLPALDKAASTVFYCQMGGRSAQAAAFAVANGFADVYNLRGGITAWIQAGLPTEV
jgi:rhodanese-related sulfurtransferase